MSVHAHAIGVIKGVGFDISDANDAFLAMLGYDRAIFDAGGLDIRALTPSQYHRLDDAAVRQASTSGEFAAPYEKALIARDGSIVPVLTFLAFIPGTVGGWIAYLVDVSAPQPASAAASDHGTSLRDVPLDFYQRLIGELIRERARTVSMLDTTDAVVWAVDPQLRLLGANQAFHDAQLRFSGRPLDIGDGVMSPMYPQELLANWASWYTRGLRGERVTATTRHEYPEGARVDEHLLSPMRDRHGDIIGVSVVSRNVSARAIAEDGLRASEARFRTLTDASPMGIFLSDAYGAIVYANRRLQQIWQSPADDMYGMGYLQRLAPDDQQAIAFAMAHALGSDVPVELECRLRVDDATTLQLRCSIAAIRDGQEVSGCVGTVEDITQRQLLAQHERQREKMESLGTLAGGIAHDFNNMLSVVLGFSDLALADASGHVDIEEHLREIRTASLRARDLVRQILTFSRRADNTRVVVNLGASTAESLRLLRATLPAGIALDIQLCEETLLVEADPTAVQQVVLNLCMNAEHAMREYGGGRLTVRLSRLGAGSPGHALLLVSDTGHGMAASVRDRLFEPFFTTKPAGEGAGMGLAVVHGIVSEMGGTINVDSVPGAGATFRVVLPLTGATVAAAEPETPQALGFGCVLLVENESALARFATIALERAGFAVRYCTNGADALRVFDHDAGQIDVVVSDISMPGLTGDRLLVELQRRAPEIPVILMTGYTESLSPEAARTAGAFALLHKPLSAGQLVAAVQDALAAVR